MRDKRGNGGMPKGDMHGATLKDIGEMARGNWCVCSNIAHTVCVNG